MHLFRSLDPAFVTTLIRRSVIMLLLALNLLMLATRASAQEAHVLLSEIAQNHCIKCHKGKDAEAEIDLVRLTQRPVREADYRIWDKVARALATGEMPPKSAKSPPMADREKVVLAIRQSLAELARKRAGDPGPTVMGRLTNSEYDNVIRDLTGLSLRLTETFPRDGSGGEGFTNVGGLLSIASSGAFEKYMVAARKVAEHAWVTPGVGLHFRPREASVDTITARKKDIENELADLYFRATQRARLEAALAAAWRFRHRQAFGGAHLPELARLHRIDPRYAAWMWAQLHDSSASFVQSKVLNEPWSRLPPPGNDAAKSLSEIEIACSTIASNVESALHAPLGLSRDDLREGAALLKAASFSQPMPLSVAVGKSSGKFAYVTLTVTGAGIPQPGLRAIVQKPRIIVALKKDERDLASVYKDYGVDAPQIAFGRHPEAGKLAADEFVVAVPSTVVIPIPHAVIPDPTAKSPRPRVTFAASVRLDAKTPGTVQASLTSQASAEMPKIEKDFFDPYGVFHTTAGAESWIAAWKAYDDFFQRFSMPYLPHTINVGPATGFQSIGRRPEALMRFYGIPAENYLHRFESRDLWLKNCLLSPEEARRLDGLWLDAFALFNEPEGRLERFLDHYKLKADDTGLASTIESLSAKNEKITAKSVFPYFRLPSEPIVRYRAMKAAAQATTVLTEKRVADELAAFSRKAWRRPLTDSERVEIENHYRSIRTAKEGEQEAVRVVLTRILTSPNFLFKKEQTRPGKGTHPVSSHELAARLSFFLWSSIPDAGLLDAADRLKLQPAALKEQVAGMLADPRSEALAFEFFGQWLGFKNFDQFSRIDAKKFPEFTPALRKSMYDESALFFRDLVRDNRPITDVLFGDAAFLNPRLAWHYGIDAEKIDWPAESPYRDAVALAKLKKDARIDQPLYRVDVADSGRGGVLGMGSVLTSTSSPLRTSPSIRGKWLYESILGRDIPEPPADIPMIPDDDKSQKAQTIRQRLESHRKQASCASCHARFDPLGFSLEGFDAIGRVRTKDPSGVPIDDLAELGGMEFCGVRGLRNHLRENQAEFVRNFARKLFGFALGRSIVPSDEPQIEQIVAEAARHENRFSSFVHAIISTQQFQHRRGGEYVDPTAPE